MSPTHDLTNVPPPRREETIRRIAAIEDFIRSPGRAAAERHASMIGISPAQFYNLVKAWKGLGRAEIIARRGGGGRTSKAFGAEQHGFIDAVIKEQPSLAPRLLVRLIMERARERGISMPRQELVTREVSRRRPSVLPGAVVQGFDLALDHTVLELPVDFGAGPPVRPLATVVIDVARHSIVGLALSDGLPRAEVAAAAILDALRHAGTQMRNPPYPRLRLLRSAASDASWNLFDAALDVAGVAVEQHAQDRYDDGQLVEALVGRSTGWLRLKPRLVWSKPSRRLRPTNDSRPALASAAAVEAIRPLITRQAPDAVLNSMPEELRLSLIRALSDLRGKRP